MVCSARCPYCSQDMLPKARVLYCSATGVTDIGKRSLRCLHCLSYAAGGHRRTSGSTDSALYELHTGVACDGACAPGNCTNASWTRGVCIVYRMFLFFMFPCSRVPVSPCPLEIKRRLRYNSASTRELFSRKFPHNSPLHCNNCLLQNIIYVSGTVFVLPATEILPHFCFLFFRAVTRRQGTWRMRRV